MDFPKEDRQKKKIVPSSQTSYHKPSTLHTQNNQYISNSKGSIRIEQYEYDEENMLGQGFTSKVYLGRLADAPRKQFAIKVVDKRKISRVKENL